MTDWPVQKLEKLANERGFLADPTPKELAEFLWALLTYPWVPKTRPRS